MTLEELHEKCMVCKRCRLWEEATQAVPGEGASDAEIMFIGEGPGKKEDESGKPFVGPAGKFLDELLDSIGLKRADVFIANMVKHRPPGNRDPSPDEIEACRPWLDKQIELIKPKIFVPLGRYAMYKFMPNATISREHGKIYSRAGKVYFLMYHPAAALYRGSMRSVLLEDFKVLRKFLDGEVQAESLNDAVANIMKEKEDAGKSKGKADKKDSSQVGMKLD